MGDFERRRAGDEALLVGLLSGLTIKEAAGRAGVGESTARRRLRDAAFRAELDRQRRELLALVAAQVAALAEEALATLRELLGKGTPAPQRLGAAREALRFAAELSGSRDVVERLEALELSLEQAGIDIRGLGSVA